MIIGIIIGFVLGITFAVLSLAVSLWLSNQRKDVLTVAKAISASRIKAKIIEPTSDIERARTEKLGKTLEDGIPLEELL